VDRQSEITARLHDLREGDHDAMARLVPLVYDELRRVAHRQLAGEHEGHTVDTTGLVHEAYLRLAAQEHADWKDRGHFFAAASLAMRRVLVDYARQHRAAKRGGALTQVPLEDTMAIVEERANVLLELDEALGRLAALDERLSRVVECRFFGGLTEEETAEALGVTSRTVRRDWIKARGWLHQELRA
jgi:RNA polymerase sigma factor (TIGR02999 family)